MQHCMGCNKEGSTHSAAKTKVPPLHIFWTKVSGRIVKNFACPQCRHSIWQGNPKAFSQHVQIYTELCGRKCSA